MLVDLDVIIRHRTDQAVKVDHPDSNSQGTWVPLSQCELEPDDPEHRGEAILTMERYLAEDKGLA